jgi:hypothetical protein
MEEMRTGYTPAQVRERGIAPFARATRAQFARYVRAQAQIDTAIKSVESRRPSICCGGPG